MNLRNKYIFTSKLFKLQKLKLVHLKPIESGHETNTMIHGKTRRDKLSIGSEGRIKN